VTYLVDSNIFIYATKPEDSVAYHLLLNNDNFFFSSITSIEVLGYNKLTSETKSDLKQIFSAGTEIGISKDIVKKSIELRQEKMMSLGDTIIAATAIVNDLVLLTRNIDDFKNLNFKLENPYI
jgi:predicted nucleic acid-binding protein